MAVLAVALGSAMVIALLETDQTTPERVAEVQYVTVPREPKIVYVDRIVPQVAPQIVYVPTPVPVEQEQQVVEIEVSFSSAPLDEPTVAPPPPEPPPPVAVTPPVEPPVVVAAVCEHRGKGVGKQVGVCRKQGFP